nr:branched-chain amino acid ABC transporter permease [Kaustia mangrovi]
MTMSEAANKVAEATQTGTGRRRFAARHWIALAAFTALALVPVVATLDDDPFLMLMGTRIMIFAMAAVSLDLILGYGAMVSFGHAAFIGLGAYAIGIASYHGLEEALVTFPLAIVSAAVFALVTGAICLKTRGVYFIMITLAFGQMIYYTATSLSAYGGDDGLTIWSRSTVLGSGILENDTVFFYVVLALLAGAYLLCRTVVASRFGRVLMGCRQSPMRMRALGVDPFAYQLVAYCIAGAIAGLAGALLANQIEFVSPAYMSWQRSGDLIIMVVLGGMGTLTGPILGAAGYLALEEILSHITQHWRIIFGPLIILIVLFARGGAIRLLDRRRDHG